MSDMSRPRPLAPAAEHQQHDELLVSQLAAGDPLDEAQQRQAQHLLTSCAACALLATDLRAIWGAVAREPMPPRRRDFRLAPEQAEQLRGNAATRLLRRLSLPRSPAFRPAAAGLLSVGLAFMVAGYVWPDDGSVPVVGDMNVVPAASEGRAPVVSPAFDELLRYQGGAPLEATEGLVTESLADDAVAVPGGAQKSHATRALEGAEGDLDEWADGAAGALPQAPAAESALEAASEPGLAERFEAADTQSTISAEESEVAMSGMADDAENEIGLVEAAVPVEVETPALDPIVDSVTADPVGTDSMLLLVGLGLAALGAVLLLLAWLARRARDPLLR